MKILLIGFFGRTYMPYIEHYERLLKAQHISYDVCFFDRSCTKPIDIKKTEFGTEYIFHCKTNANAFSKIFPAFNYIKKVKKIIYKNKYDKLIVFTTMPAALMSMILLNKYSDKFIFDYRDYTYEKFKFFNRLVEKVMKKASLVCFSSKGYLIYYPELDNYIITHNITNLECCVGISDDLKSKSHICIGFLGYVRYFDVNSRLIKAFANDSTYSLMYTGSRFSDCDLESLCSSLKITNVMLKGAFDNSEKPKLYEQIDMINSIYSLNSPEVKQAVPNRIYDAVLYKKPIIVSDGTYLAELVKKYDIGVVVDPFSNDMKKDICDYVSNFNNDIFTKNCERFLEDIKGDLNIFEKKVIDFLNEK